MKVLVVGGGIMGLAAAWACARAGHEVVLFEQGPLPNPKASSYDQSRLIRYPYGAKAGYARMVRHAYAANGLLQAELGVDAQVETGTLIVVRASDPWADATRRSLDELAVPYDVLTAAALAARFPLLDTTGVGWGLWTPTGGVVLARRLLIALTDWLERQPGVALSAQTRVVGVDLPKATLRLATGETHNGDRLVVAAGPWTGDLMPEWRAELRASRQVALDLDMAAPLRAAWAAMPMVLDGIAWRGNGFYAVPPVAGLPLKVGDHSFSLQGHPDVDRTPTAAEREAIMTLVRAGLRTPEAYHERDARTCFYTVAHQERFRAERHGRSLVLAGFSGHGFKFGALVGLAAALHLEDRIEADELAHWLAGHPADLPRALACDGLMTAGPGLR